MLEDKVPILTFTYFNHRDQLARRRVRPLSCWSGVSDHYPGEAWYLRAYDLDRQAVRDFRLDRITGISQEPPPQCQSSPATARDSNQTTATSQEPPCKSQPPAASSPDESTPITSSAP